MSSILDSQDPSEWSRDSSSESANGFAVDSMNLEASRMPDTIGRYELIRQLGRGGFGFVYLAEDPELRRQVAIKVPRWDRPLTKESEERFLKQGKLLAQVEFPSIVAVYDLGVDDGVPYVVMQYVEGDTLEYYLRQGKMNPAQRLRILMQIAITLREAHKQSIVHRDLKPSNIVIDSKGRISLVDFGMALHDDLTVSDFKLNSPAGTPQYMAPEQIRGENHRINDRTDIWAFGVMMYQMLTGKMPFQPKEGEDLKRLICRATPKALRSRREWISKELDRICMRCLHKLMDGRYQLMVDLIDELREASLELFPDCLTGRPTDFDFDVSTLSKSSHPDAPLSGSKIEFGSFAAESKSTGVASYGSFSTNDTLKILPKGLRHFDENDHHFFVQMLPGPVDRYNMPESLRFWTGRFGTARQVEQVPVCVLWGASGSGKTSFVRAGLLPRLQDEANTVYVDCGTKDLAQAIRGRIYRTLVMTPHDTDLVNCMRKLRQREGLLGRKKIVLVLDHFEQWWDSSTVETRQAIAAALRQCDFESLQCLIVVRDNYWSSISDFMRMVEQPIVEHQNAAALPLLDAILAKKILIAYGRATNCLPNTDVRLTEKQKKFARQAIESITEPDGVLSVRLAILMEMIADRDWGATNFKKTYGDDGIGAAYLKKNLEDNNRVVSAGWLPVCETIFRSLLPDMVDNENETSIGVLRESELLRIAKRDGTESQFVAALRYLNNDLKLICPVETEPMTLEAHTDLADSSDDEIAYRLNHGFFIPAIRQWVRARQAKTVASRARYRFGELAKQYKANKDPHFYPNFREYIQTLLFVRGKRLNASSRGFLKRVHKHYLKRTAIAVSVVAAVTFGVVRYINHRSLTQQIRSALVCSGDEALEMAEILKANSKMAIAILAEAKEDVDHHIQSRARVLSAIVDPELHEIFDPNDKTRIELLIASIPNSRQGDLKLYDVVFDNWDVENRGNLVSMLRTQNRKEFDDQFALARMAILLAEQNDFEVMASLIKGFEDPTQTTAFVDEFSVWNSSPYPLAQWLAQSNDATIKTNGLESLAFHKYANAANSLPQKEREEIQAAIQETYSNATDGGTATMAEFCARKWQLILHPVDHPFFKHVNYLDGSSFVGANELRNNFRMVKVPAGVLVDPRDVLKSKTPIPVESLWVLPTEVSVRMFTQYVQWLGLSQDMGHRARVDEMIHEPWWNSEEHLDKPIVDIRLVDVLSFLNWLSWKHGLTPCYRQTVDDPGLVLEPFPPDLREENLDPPLFYFDKAANGYRLPYEFESLYFTRAGNQLETCQSWGDGKDLASDLIARGALADEVATRLHRISSRYFSNQDSNVDEQCSVVDARAPNKFGLHEMQGNACEMVWLTIAVDRSEMGATGCSVKVSLSAGSVDRYLPVLSKKVANGKFGFRFVRDSK